MAVNKPARPCEGKVRILRGGDVLHVFDSISDAFSYVYQHDLLGWVMIQIQH